VSPSDQLSTVVLLMYSPSVGPSTWRGVADHLREASVDVRVPSFSVRASRCGPTWRAAACVFVDASLPPEDGESAVVPTDFLPFLRANAVDGILPRWSDWWEEEDIASLYPDQETRSALTAEEPQLPLVYYEQTIPVPGGWDRRPCAYLWFGPPYDETAKLAGDRGWIVEHLGGAHLHMVIDPAAVADRIQALAETVFGDREDASLATRLLTATEGGPQCVSRHCSTSMGTCQHSRPF